MTDQVTPFDDDVESKEVEAKTDDDKSTVQPEIKSQIPEGMEDWIGEGKKYATVEDALRSIPHAQDFIEKMKDENATEREKSAQMSERLARVESVMEAISKKPTNEGQKPMTQEELDALIESKLTLKEQNDIARANVNSVKETFIEKFGDKEKANEAYKQKATDLGMPVEELNKLSAKSPNAVYAMFGLAPKSDSVPNRIKNDVNSEADVNNKADETPAIKSVMGSSTHKDDINAWRAAAPTE